VMAGVLRILSRKHENKLREKGMGKLARGCASNPEMSSTKSGNESTHAREALKECSGFITSNLVAYVSFSWNLLDTLLPRGKRNTKSATRMLSSDHAAKSWRVGLPET
jgi:hypothetical protein